MLTPLLIGFALGALIGALAWRFGALSVSGAAAAAVSGGLIFGLGGLPWAALLLSFFFSSSALSRAFARRKSSLTEKFSKGSRRDWGQVLANGGLGAVLVLSQASAGRPEWAWVAFAGAMAAVNADTWATEIGVLSPSAPRLITNGKVVEHGTSGGVSLWGYLAVLAGSALIGLVAALFTQWTELPRLLAVVVIGGLAGASFDSYLGATVQAVYRCPSCQKDTERSPLHTCGTPTVRVRGWPWLNNDLVNFACSLVGASVALGAWFLIGLF